jgi:hypothetical protein
MQMQHHAGFALAAMNAMPVFVGVEQPIHVDQPRPHHADREHAELDAQIAADDLQQLRLAAMRVQEQDLADAGAMHAFADFVPDPAKGLVRQGQRARKRQMLVGLSDRQHRKHQGGAIRRHQFHRPRHDAGIDRGVDPDRQMRSVLFDGTDRKDRDHALRIETRESPASSDPTTNAI